MDWPLLEDEGMMGNNGNEEDEEKGVCVQKQYELQTPECLISYFSSRFRFSLIILRQNNCTTTL